MLKKPDDHKSKADSPPPSGDPRGKAKESGFHLPLFQWEAAHRLSMTLTPTPEGLPEEIAQTVSSLPPQPGILVVDDTDWSREITIAYLQRLGVPIEEAASGKEALEKAARNSPAVILSDWVMPGMDGLELCRAIRHDPQLAKTHFLILTARGEKEDLVQAFDAGADDFLTKPVDQNELRARVMVGIRMAALYRESELHRLQTEVTAESLDKARDRLRVANERLDQQIREIAGLQESFLPTRFPSVGGLSFAAFCRPCYEVGGDYYDVFTMPDGRVCITIADVTGHGARAAVCMAMTRSLTRAAATQIHPDQGPVWMFETLNKWLCDQLADFQFVTMWMGLWNPKTGILQYARAGHPSAILWPPNGAPSLLSKEGVHPLGIRPYSTRPKEEQIALSNGDRLLLYTDGWTEAMNAQGLLLEDQGFLNAVRELEGVPFEGIPVALFHKLERFVADTVLNDDISLLIFERREDSASSTS